jgi:hypothetical protein
VSPLTRRLAAVLIAGAVAVGTTGCINMPTDGPVVETGTVGADDQSSAFYIDAKPPREDASPADIVGGFLDAMTAFPINVTVAREYLTREGGARWSPEERTITYSETFPASGTERIRLRLGGAEQLDERGSYLGTLPGSEERLEFPMERDENGQWRIARAPDALIVPSSWFETRFRQVSLYYFEPTARILVPEPVFVPTGQQLPTALVNALLVGPARSLRDVSTTFLPPGLELYGGAVQVSDEGVAEIDLRGFSGQLSPEDSELVLAQLAWTLRQEPSITALRVTLGGRQLTLSGAVGPFPVNDQGAEYDPTLLEASSLLYGLQDGRLISGPPEALGPVEGPMGTSELGVREVAVNLTATRVAGVTGDGSRVLVSSVRGPDPSVEEVVSGAEDLLRPSWDFTDRLWFVDARASGAEVGYLAGGRPDSVRVRGLTGRRVTHMIVSRDGTRLVAVVRHDKGDRVMVSRIRHDAEGRVVGATRARKIAVEPGLRIRDIGWAAPTGLAILTPLSAEFVQVRTLSVDGAPTGLDTQISRIADRVVALATSPAEAQNLFALVGNRDLLDLTVGGTAGAPIDPRVDTLDYVG